ncbi:MAG: GAK system CofD-like protein [Proteobacteria bacterium]|nr:GAK system CofD-like protein [Pseudomonadota bacterium]MBU4275488.1 GAK system CofD-like protein [Pseudomonadota bacterium]MBU4382765.1 GAK system CofD-like protein [Pseudomonadota bacterium]MBU4605640.1 GAK system CofD-like protein [Pseudomonadota bacterium]MCG2765280.1 GAK system CofD-like protein [Desulfarculaceae bacterium]
MSDKGGLTITRPLRVPDPVRLARYARVPELGPSILFFSGGSGPGPMCRELINYTHNSIHLITPFDSGGSSAVLRRAFAMPAVGDLRNRMMALSDMSVRGNAEVRKLFAYRLPVEADAGELVERLETMTAGDDPMVAAIPDPLRKIIRNHLSYFLGAMPGDFDLAGASIGNLVLVGGYLNNGRHLDPVIFLFSKLAEVRGVVRPVVNRNLHLAARLTDGSLVLGQHRITGRSEPPLSAPIVELRLNQGLDLERPVTAEIRPKVHRLIAQAELICYPVGSFYTSLLASLLPGGIGEAVAANPCPKVFVPNTAPDKEVLAGGVAQRAAELMAALGAAGSPQRVEGRVLDYVLVDRGWSEYPGGLDRRALEDMGLRIIEADLMTSDSAPLTDGRLLAEALLSLV